MKIQVNSDAVVVWTRNLERMGKTAFPNAIRKTLNKTALDVKKNTMPDKAKVFVNRSPNFFRANSKVNFANGNNIKTLHSIVGMFDNKLTGAHNYAVEDLQQQEHGGKIKKKSFIPLPGSRTGKSIRKPVRANARLTALRKNKLINGKATSGASWSQVAIKSAVHAGKDGLVLMPGRKHSVVWKITSIRRIGPNKRNTVFKKTKLYSFNKNRQVTIHRPAHFMEKASLKSAQKMDNYFIMEAKRAIVKYYRK